MRPKFSNFDSLQRPLMASEVNQLRQSFIRTPRAFRNGMTLAYWIKIEVSRASRSFESDLTRFSEKVEASRTASFRGQEIFPMVSGDVPRYTKEVLRKKSKFIFLTLQPLSQISKTSPKAELAYGWSATMTMSLTLTFQKLSTQKRKSFVLV